MFITMVGLVSASFVLVVMLVRYFTGDMIDDHGKPEFFKGKTRINDVLKAIIGILAKPSAIASTAFPEGLLLAVTIPVAYSTYRMAAEKKALVRSFSALEKVGSTSVICTNEKGNLTTHKLEVCQFWFGQDSTTFSSIAPNVRELLLHVVSSARSFPESIELVIQDWALKQMNVDDELVTANDQRILHQKDDPEVILGKCSKYYDEHGHIKEITDDIRKKLEQMVLEMKSKCLQCIAFSCSDIISRDNELISEEECCLTLLGSVDVTYSCPPEIKETVIDCAGVNIKLVTKSELPTARAIAFQSGILDPNQEITTGEEVVEGLDFQNYPEQEKLEKSDKVHVMARTSTFQRLHFVQCLKQKGHVVTITGDSAGDVAVLKEAHIGFSFQGTNYIANESSDIIILDDNFISIVTH